MRKKRLIAFGLLLVSALLPAMLLRGAITASGSVAPNEDRKTIQLFTIPWTSDSSGNAAGLITKDGTNARDFNGTLMQVAFSPGSGGSQPSDAYDVTITNVAGIDVLGGLGANLSNSAGKQDTPVTSTNAFPFVLAGSCTLSVSNAGNTKTGTIYLFVRNY